MRDHDISAVLLARSQAPHVFSVPTTRLMLRRALLSRLRCSKHPIRTVRSISDTCRELRVVLDEAPKNRRATAGRGSGLVARGAHRD